jgi:hypothetical protein
MKNLLNWFKSLLLKEKFNPYLLVNYNLVFEHTEYKKHRLSGYTEWKLENDMLKSNKDYKYGYFEILGNDSITLSSDKISPLKISLDINGSLCFETLEFKIKQNWITNKKNKFVKYGLFWSPTKLMVIVDENVVYKTSDIQIVKYFIEPMKIYTSKECEYIKVYQQNN